jgi:hypothetical protein
MPGVMNNFVYQVWRTWANVEKYSPQRFVAICLQHPQEWSFQQSSTTVGGKESDSNATTLSSFFYLLAAGLSLFLLLGLSACSDNFCIAERGRKPDSKSADVILKVHLLPPSHRATTVNIFVVAGALFSKQALVHRQSVHFHDHNQRR